MRIPAFITKLAKVCDHESSRYALGGVQCVSDGKTAQLTATDGRILANVYCDDDDIEPKPVSAIVDAKEVPNATTLKSAVYFDGKAMRVGGKIVGEPTPIDGRFPRIEDVFQPIEDEPDVYVSVQLDAALLRKLADLAAAMNDDDSTKGITLYVCNATSAVFASCRSTSGHVARMAIMPRAADGKYRPAPFPPRPGTAPAAEKPAAESVVVEDEQPAPPPEFMDDKQVAAAIAEPTDWSVDLAPI